MLLLIIFINPQRCNSIFYSTVLLFETCILLTQPPFHIQAISGLCELLHDLRVVRDSESSEDSWEKFEGTLPEEHPQTWPASQEIIMNNFPSLASLLLLLYGSYVGVMAPLHQTTSANSKSAFNFVPNRGATTLVPTK